MTPWPDQRLTSLFGIEHPILQAPLAEVGGPRLAAAVSQAGGLGALACATLSLSKAEADIAAYRAATDRPLNLNFFCHPNTPVGADLLAAWRAQLAPYYRELAAAEPRDTPSVTWTSFNDEHLGLILAARPEVVSFHLGLPDGRLLSRVKATGAKVICSATTAAEARWLEDHGCDAVIAMGFEAGGHRGSFLCNDEDTIIAGSQVGGLALIPQVVDAVSLPVIAAGGIADGRGVVAALALGAAAVQVGTAYLLSPEADVPPYHRAALARAREDSTILTNVFTGRAARGVVNRLVREEGPLSPVAPPFPHAHTALEPLKAAAPAEFSHVWAGQAAALVRPAPAGEFTRALAADALSRLERWPRP
ncbi:MAG: nitronate monooxygenase [Caulobacter sp.]|nr:nitronate monooxygenase [Caulobacter sp.]